jgi:RNA polymerase sigma-70 factor (ECF subfamily)
MLSLNLVPLKPSRRRRVDVSAKPTHRELAEPDLVAAILSGDPRAPCLLWNRYADLVFRILRRTLGTDHLIDDLAQEAFLCVFQKLPSLRNPGALRPFIAATTLFVAKAEIRRRCSTRRGLSSYENLTLAGDSETEIGDIDAREALLRFCRLLNRLNARDRSAFVLRFIDAMKLADVASALRISIATAKRRLARGWARLALLAERDPLLSRYQQRLAHPQRPSKTTCIAAVSD